MENHTRGKDNLRIKKILLNKNILVLFFLLLFNTYYFLIHFDLVLSITFLHSKAEFSYFDSITF